MTPREAWTVALVFGGLLLAEVVAAAVVVRLCIEALDAVTELVSIVAR